MYRFIYIYVCMWGMCVCLKEIPNEWANKLYSARPMEIAFRLKYKKIPIMGVNFNFCEQKNKRTANSFCFSFSRKVILR